VVRVDPRRTSGENNVSLLEIAFDYSLFTIRYRLSLKLYSWCFLRARFGLEDLFRRKMEQQTVCQTIGKYPDGRVEFLHRFVIAGTGNIYPVLRAFELVLEIKEVLVCFEVGIFFNNDHES